MNKTIQCIDWGLIEYNEAWKAQEALFASTIQHKINQEETENYLLFSEHQHVYTLGKSGNRQNLLIAKNLCESRNIDLHAIDRGVTLLTTVRVSW